MDYLVWIVLYKNGVEKCYRTPVEDKKLEDESYLRKLKDELAGKKSRGEAFILVTLKGVAIIDTKEICSVEIMRSGMEG